MISAHYLVIMSQDGVLSSTSFIYGLEESKRSINEDYILRIVSICVHEQFKRVDLRSFAHDASNEMGCKAFVKSQDAVFGHNEIHGWNNFRVIVLAS